MPYIETIETNIKEAPRKLTLAPCTFVTGLNRTGKSSILDAFRLLFTGKHPVGGHPSDLIDLVPPGQQSLYVYGTGDRPSDLIAWKMNIEEGLPKKPHPPAGKGVFNHSKLAECLVLDHGAGLRDGAEKMRRRLVDRFGDLTQLPTPIGLDPEQQELWKEGASACNGAKDFAAQLVEMTKWFKSQAVERNKRASLCEDVIRATAPNEDDILTETVRDQVKSQIAKAKAQEAYDRGASKLARIQEEIDATIAEIDALDTPEKRAEEEKHLAKKKEADSLLQRHRALKKLVESAIACGGEACPVCQNPNPNFDQAMDTVDRLIEEATAQFTEHAEAARRIHDELRRDEKDRALARKEDLQEELLTKNPNYKGQTSEELQKILDRHVAAVEARRLVKDQTEDMHRLRRESETCKLLNAQAVKEVKRVVKSIQSKAEDAVNACLPADGFKAHVHLNEKSAEWRMLGNDGRAHKRGARCGSEQGSLLYAFAEAFAPEDVPARIVLLDDVDLGVFDKLRLTELCSRFKQAVDEGRLDQVIIGWNRPEEAPSDWHVVQLPISTNTQE